MSSSLQQKDSSAGTGLSVIRTGIAVGLSAGVLYLFCWLGAVIGVVPVTHMYLQLFSAAEQTSIAALAEGTTASIAFGSFAGVIFGVVSRALAQSGRR
jgi:hypothetical protein